MAIAVTQSAAEHIGRQLSGRGAGQGIRVGVRSSGCSGMAYVLDFVDQPQAEDLVFEQHGVRVFVDPDSMAYLEGLELDFSKDGLNEGLVFKNPNVTAECGCGESFTV